ncbi:MAG: LacI family DNA-binding transcriptional regulator [Clostridia bacterium]|nr:LacI family DNA-binding transcriptional regulator [Clostridia bacterium]
MKHVTIRDLSAACGLSVSTVSKALNGYSDISDETRQAVISAAAELGYFPNATARTLKTSRSHNLGVLFVDEYQSGLTHPFFAALLNAFKMEAESRGYDITFISSNLGASAMSYLSHCRYRNVDGVCLACVEFTSPAIRELVESAIPCVTIDHVFNRWPSVLSDNVGGMQHLTDYVISRGHRRIAFVHGQRNSSVTEKRITGFYRSLETHGIPPENVILREGVYVDPQISYQITNELLGMSDPPTCILLPDDHAYIGAMEAAVQQNIKIGRDISFAGFDGISMTQSLHPRLTSVQQDTEAIGREAARRLIECVEKPNTAGSEPVTIPCKLIRGETVGEVVNTAPVRRP